MKTLALLALIPLATACASTEPVEPRAGRAESEFVTGSRIPGKGRVSTTIERDELERLRSTTKEPYPASLSKP